jgi:hypothetical protein
MLELTIGHLGVSGITYGYSRSSSHCIFLTNLLHFNRAGPPLFFGVLDGILLLRIVALYGRSKRGLFEQYLCVSAILKHICPSIDDPAHSHRR